MRYLIILLILLSSCAVKTTEQYLKEGYKLHTVKGIIVHQQKSTIYLDTIENNIKVCFYEGEGQLNDTITVTYLITKYQNEFVK